MKLKMLSKYNFNPYLRLAVDSKIVRFSCPGFTMFISSKKILFDASDDPVFRLRECVEAEETSRYIREHGQELLKYEQEKAEKFRNQRMAEKQAGLFISM